MSRPDYKYGRSPDATKARIAAINFPFQMMDEVLDRAELDPDSRMRMCKALDEWVLSRVVRMNLRDGLSAEDLHSVAIPSGDGESFLYVITDRNVFREEG